MPLETGSFVNDLVTTNPPASDPVGQGDDHIRLIKSVLQNTLPRSNSALGKGFSQDVSGSITALQAYQHVLVTNSATATVQFSIPPSSSITNGWSFRVSTDAGVFVILNRLGADLINGGTSFTIPPESVGELNYLGSAVFRASYRPAGIGGRVLFSNPVQFNSTITVSGAAQFGSTITVSGAAITGGPVTVGGTLTVSGAAVFGGPVTVGNTLSVSGAATLGVVSTGALTVNGSTTLSGAATLKSTVSIAGAAVMGSTTGFRGAATFDSTISVSADATFKSNVSIAGAVAMGSATIGTLNVTGTTTMNSGLTVSGSAYFNGTVTFSAATTFLSVINLTSGQISFPGTQIPHAGANVLDDYEEGTWTPVFTCVVPGDLSISGASVAGNYTKIGNTVHVWCVYTATTVTHTTASGSMVITGIPFAIGATTCGPIIAGTLDNIVLTDFSGATFSAIGGNSRFDIGLSNLNNGAATQSLSIAGHTSGSGLFLVGEVTYKV